MGKKIIKIKIILLIFTLTVIYISCFFGKKYFGTIGVYSSLSVIGILLWLAWVFLEYKEII